MTQTPPKKSRAPLLWRLMPLLLFAVGYDAIVASQSGKTGLAWDESYFYDSARLANEWVDKIFAGERPYDDATIIRHWAYTPEHAAVGRIVAAVGLRVFSQPGREIYAMRWPMAVLFGLTLVLINALGRRAWENNWAGLATALIYGTMPRVFGQTLLVTHETPMIFLTLLFYLCFLRGLESALWSAACGLVLGLLLACKINGFFAPIPLVLWAQVYARRRQAGNLYAMIFMAPLAMVAVWPLLWHDPVARVLDYLAFFARHQMIGLWFMGRQWGFEFPNAPWFYPPEITAVATPIAALVLCAAGALATLADVRRRNLGVLFILMVLMTYAVACAPGTPRYDGLRLFAPALPFIALLAGGGVAALAEFCRKEKMREAARAALTLGAAAAGAAAIALYHPATLSYYNAFAGGLKGAHASGKYETTYWGEAVGDEAIAALNRLPDGAGVKPLGYHADCLWLLQRLGMLNPTLKIDDTAKVDAHLVLYRRGFFTDASRELFDKNSWQGKALAPEQKIIWSRDGVPMAGLFWTAGGAMPLKPEAPNP